MGKSVIHSAQEGAHQAEEGHMGLHRGCREVADGESLVMGESLCCGFCRKEWVRQVSRPGTGHFGEPQRAVSTGLSEVWAPEQRDQGRGPCPGELFPSEDSGDSGRDSLSRASQAPAVRASGCRRGVHSLVSLGLRRGLCCARRARLGRRGVPPEPCLSGAPSLQEASFEYLQNEGERLLLEAMDELEVAFNNTSVRTDCNHIFLNFVPTVIMDPYKVSLRGPRPLRAQFPGPVALRAMRPGALPPGARD